MTEVLEIRWTVVRRDIKSTAVVDRRSGHVVVTDPTIAPSARPSEFRQVSEALVSFVGAAVDEMQKEKE